MLDLIVLHGEFSIFTVRGNFWYQIYRNRRKKVLCSRLSLITLTKGYYMYYRAYLTLIELVLLIFILILLIIIFIIVVERD